MIYLCIFMILVYGLFKNKKTMMVFQQNWYNSNNWYLHWILKNKKEVFLSLDLILILVSIFLFLNNLLIYAILLIAFCLIMNFRKINKGKKYKKPLVFTARVKRLFITLYLIYLLPLLFLHNNINIYILYISVITYLNYLVLYLVNIINKPIEKSVLLYFKTKAVNKLKSLKHMEIIGITGSYGKTSSKNIVNDILNIKFTSFKTPLNYNTENGLILTVNKHLDKFNDFFVAEMGALNVHQIAQYCKFIKPKYGILTNIGKAHLESFKTIENVQIGKFALIESLPLDGVGILNKDDPMQVSYKLKNKCKIIWVGIDNEADYQAKNIKCTNEGTSFDVMINDSVYTFKTRLLGKFNVYNILAGIALGTHLGISVEMLKQAVSNVTAVEHRLQLINRGDITIIDDAYNSNPKGFRMALEVLGMMKGTKIIVTPGMVELGSEQYSANFDIAANIAKTCDHAILVGSKQTIPIQDGLKKSKYKNMHVVESINEAFKLLEKIKGKDTFVLLENDLPDIY